MTDQEVRDWLDGLVPSVSGFILRRSADATGVSGTGVVADGAMFPDGKTVTRWRGGSTGVAQTCVWDSIQHVRRIHGHDGATVIEFLPTDVLVRMIRELLDAAAVLSDYDAQIIRGAATRVLAEHREFQNQLNRAGRGEATDD